MRGTLGIELYDDQLPKLIADSGSVVEVAHGKELVLTSVGALAEQVVRQALLVGSGKVDVTSGAIGGFDLFCGRGVWRNRTCEDSYQQECTSSGSGLDVRGRTGRTKCRNGTI